MTAARTTSAAAVADASSALGVPGSRSVAAPASTVARRSDSAASAPQRGGAKPDGPARTSLLDDRWILAGLFALPLGVCVRGLGYYSSPIAERLRSPLHPWLKPGGTLGLAFGVMGFMMFVFMWLYPLRKKIRWLAWTGKLGSWLRIHILAGLWIPLVVAVHAAWRFEGVIGLGYWAMLIVSMSGVIGRYLYVRIPHSHGGLELSLEEVAAERATLISRISAALGVEAAEVARMLAIEPASDAKLSWSQTLIKLFKDDHARGQALKRLRREWCQRSAGRRNVDPRTLKKVLKLARREMALQQQVRMLEATRLVFGYWHVAHRPVAVTALVAVTVHVIVAVMIGGVAGSHMR